MRARGFVVAAALLLALFPACRASPSMEGDGSGATVSSAAARSNGTSTSAAVLKSRVLVVAAGDIACDAEPRTHGDACRYGDTARLIAGRAVDAVLPLGDEQYDVGAYEAFVDHFD